MAPGDISRVDAPSLEGCWYVDTGMYDVSGYGSVYLLTADRPVLIETGIGTHSDRILSLLESADISPTELAYICPTHVHLDHAGGAGILAEACPNATVAIHERGARHLEDPSRLVAGTKAAVGEQWQYYTEPTPVPGDRIEPLADGDEIDLGSYTIRTIEVPGHAPHQHAFWVPEANAVFPGDALGIYNQPTGWLGPTTPPPDFDFEQCLDDIDRLEALGAEVALFSHFGPVFETDIYDRYATVLRTWVDAVRAARERADSDEAAVEALVDTHAPVDQFGREKALPETAMNARGVLGDLG